MWTRGRGRDTAGGRLFNEKRGPSTVDPPPHTPASTSAPHHIPPARLAVDSRQPLSRTPPPPEHASPHPPRSAPQRVTQRASRAAGRTRRPQVCAASCSRSRRHRSCKREDDAAVSMRLAFTSAAAADRRRSLARRTRVSASLVVPVNQSEQALSTASRVH